MQIVNAPRDTHIHQLLTFSQYPTTVFTPSRTKPGYLIRVTIAAKFNYTIPFGWPALQVRRQTNSTNGSYTSIYITQREPRPTGYLNVFEYDLSDNAFEVQPGERIRLFWFPLSSYPARYSLAYDEWGAMAMGSIIDIQNVTTMSTISTPELTYGGTQPNPTNGSSGITSSVEPQNSMITTEMDITVQSKQPHVSEATTAIVGGVLCILTIILLVVLAITVFVVFRRRNHTKDFSPSGNELDASVLPISLAPIIHNPTYSLVDSEFHNHYTI